MESTNSNDGLLGAGQLVTCRLEELRPHPSYLRHHLAVSASQLSALAERGDRAFLEPLVVTQDRTILDGYARLELARLQGRATLSCIEYELTESEAQGFFSYCVQPIETSARLRSMCSNLTNTIPSQRSSVSE